MRSFCFLFTASQTNSTPAHSYSPGTHTSTHSITNAYTFPFSLPDFHMNALEFLHHPVTAGLRTLLRNDGKQEECWKSVCFLRTVICTVWPKYQVLYLIILLFYVVLFLVNCLHYKELGYIYPENGRRDDWIIRIKKCIRYTNTKKDIINIKK